MLGGKQGTSELPACLATSFFVTLENFPSVALKPGDGVTDPILVPGKGHVMPVGQSQHSATLAGDQLRGGHGPKAMQPGYCRWEEVISFH